MPDRIAAWEKVWGAYVDALAARRAAEERSGKVRRALTLRVGLAHSRLIRWCRENNESVPLT